MSSPLKPFIIAAHRQERRRSTAWFAIAAAIMLFVLALCSGPDRVTMEQMLHESRDMPRASMPIEIVIVDLGEDAWGTCDKLADRFVIEISDDLDPWHATRVLLHEWAHCLSWDDEVENGDHCDEWGEAYARCYRALFPPENDK